jgi:general secretion pathway protein J
MIAPLGARARPSLPQGGFTLLEMLVALAVLGLLVVGLNRSVRTGLDLWRAQSRQVGSTAEVDATARTLRTLLASLPISPGIAADPAAPPASISFVGTSSQLTFVGDLPTGFGTSRRADIILVVRNGRLMLRWTPHHHQAGGAREPVTETELMQRVVRLDLAYWDSAAPDSQPGWVGRWDGPGLPELIRIQLGFADGDIRRWPDLLIAPLLFAPAI